MADFGRMKGAGYCVKGDRTRTKTEDVLEATNGLEGYYQRQVR